MKRLLSAALALSLLSGTAVYAEPFDHRGGQHERHDYDRNYRGGDHWRHRDRDNGAGTAIAIGVGLLALTAILASQDNDRERDVRYDRRYDYRYDAPPPPPTYDDEPSD